MLINLIITVLDKSSLGDFLLICRQNEMPLVLSTFGEGTAEIKYLNRYELEETQKALTITIASGEQTARIRREVRRKMRMDVPGNGIMLTIPIKSISGASLAYLGINDTGMKGEPEMVFEQELIFTILNRGYVDEIITAARSAGAQGGTVIHAVGTAAREMSSFLGIPISREKDILLICAPSEGKAAIMEAISRELTGKEEINGIVLSVPVSEAIGLRRDFGD